MILEHHINIFYDFGEESVRISFLNTSRLCLQELPFFF